MREDLWKESETTFLLDNWHKMPVDEISTRLNRSKASVRTKRARLGASAVKGIKPWNKAEIDFLCANADQMTAREIGVRLGRSPGSVLGKATALSLPLTSARTRYSDEDVKLCLLLHRDGVSFSEIASKMDIPYDVVRTFVVRGSKQVTRILLELSK